MDLLLGPAQRELQQRLLTPTVAIHAQFVGLSAKRFGSLAQRLTLGLEACQSKPIREELDDDIPS